MSSGFSFLIEKTAANDVKQVSHLVVEDNEFLASVNPTKVSAESSLDHQANHFEPNARGTHIFAELEQDIKIVRSSETRLVKKKKRAPKVGFARGNDCADDDIDSATGSSLSDSMSQTNSESTIPITIEEESSSCFATASVQTLTSSNEQFKVPHTFNHHTTRETDENVGRRNLHDDGNNWASNDLDIRGGIDKSPTLYLSEDVSSHQSGFPQEQRQRDLLPSGLELKLELESAHIDRVLGPYTVSVGLASDPGSIPANHSAPTVRVVASSSTQSASIVPSTAADLSPSPEVVNRGSSSMFKGMSLSMLLLGKEPATCGDEGEYLNEATDKTESTGNGKEVVVTEDSETILSEDGTRDARPDSHGIQTSTKESHSDTQSNWNTVSVTTQARGMLPTTLSSDGGSGSGSGRWSIEDDEVCASPDDNTTTGISDDITTATPTTATAAVIAKINTVDGRERVAVKESDTFIRAMDIIADFRNQLEVLIASQWTVGKEKSDQRKELNRLTQWLEEAKTRSADMEEDQLRLAGLEQFDEADLLTGTLDSLLSDICTHTERCRYLEGLEQGEVERERSNIRGNWSSSVQTVRVAQAKAITEVIDALTAITREEEGHLSANLIGRSTQLACEDELLKREKERILVEEAYIAEEERILSEQTAEMEDLITAQGGDNTIRKGELEVQQAELTSEIEELEKTLNRKKAEKRALAIELEMVNERISQIRGSFRRQILRLSDRKTLLDRTRQSCTLDREALTVSERSHNDEQNMIGSLEMCSKMWCERVRGEVVSLRRAAEVLFNETTVVSYPLHTSPKEELFLCLRDRLLAADAVLNSTLKAQADVCRLRGTLDLQVQDTVELATKLETEKKAHALARRFKEAAAVAKEEKVVFQLRDQLNEAIARNALQIQEKSVEVIQFEGIKQALTSDITVVRREMDSVRYADLKRRNTELQTSLTDILHPNYDKEEDSENGNESDNEEKGDVRKEKKERLDHSLFDMQKLHFISGTAIELINLNIQELDLEIQDLEEAYPEFRSAVTSSTLDSEPLVSPSNIVGEAKEEKICEGDEHGDLCRDSMSTLDNGEDGMVRDDSCPHCLEVDGNAAPDSAREELTSDERDSLITQVKGWLAAISSLEGQLITAADCEDYELADTLDCTITDTRIQLTASLGILQMSVDDAMK